MTSDMKFEYSDTYLYKIHVLTNSIDKLFDDTLRGKAHIGLSQFTLLLSVWQHQPVNQRTIADFLMLSSAAISRQVDIARKNGWVSVVRENEDRRDRMLEITPKGRALVNRGIGELERSVFEIFKDEDRQTSLINHINILIDNTKGVNKRKSNNILRTIDEGKSKSRSNDMSDQIPKARKLFRGDINDAVIRVQKATGVHINDGWWFSKVGNQGSTEQILDRFDNHYPDFVKQQRKK